MPKPSVHGPIPTIHNPSYRSSLGTEITVGQPSRVLETTPQQQATRRLIVEADAADGSFDTLEVEGMGLAAQNMGNGRLKLSFDIPPTIEMDGLDVDWSQSNSFEKTLAAGANAITFSNMTDGQAITVALQSDAGGSTVSWPASVKWAGGEAPTQTSTGLDVYTFVYSGSLGISGSYVQDLQVP